MDRREFIKQGVVAGGLMAGAGLAGTGCSRHPRRSLVADDPADLKDAGNISATGPRILYYASLAPSGHNSQPWAVRELDPGKWIVGSDRNRWLSVVDPDNREVLLSIGAFTENLVQAARVFRYGVQIEILAEERTDPEVLQIGLVREAGAGDPGSLRLMAARRTVKTGLRPEGLKPEDLKVLEKAAGSGLYYFPRGSSHAQAMADAAVENFRIQFGRGEAMKEAARWTRLSDKEAETYRDGLTPDGMEIQGLAGFWARHFMDNKDVTGRMWREKAVEKTAVQAREGGGWLVLTSPSGGVADLIDAGRRFQRLAMAAVPLGIGIHPMTQTLEERHGRETIRANHSPAMIPQFMLRVGYVSPYPEPVSLRRPVGWFFTGRVTG